MPAAKRWYFSVKPDRSIVVCRDKKEVVSKNGIPLGPVKDMTTGGDQIRAGGFKHNALMVCVV